MTDDLERVKEGLRGWLCRVALSEDAGQVAADHGQWWHGLPLPAEGLPAVVDGLLDVALAGGDAPAAQPVSGHLSSPIPQACQGHPG